MLQPGDKIAVVEKAKRSTKEVKCTVTAVYPRFITVDYGGYKGTIDNFDIQSGKIKIISEGKEMYKKTLPFTKSQLLEECKVHGTNAEAAFVIAGKYGCTDKQVLNAISNYNIRNKINARQEEEDMDKQRLPISKEQLLIECRSLGTDKEAIKTVATTCGATEKQIEKAILNHKIKQKLEAEKAALDALDEANKADGGIVFVDTEETLKYAEKLIEEEVYSALTINMEVPVGRPERFRLKPKVLLSQTLEIEYDLRCDDINIRDTNEGVFINIPWERLAEFIRDLQEIKDIAG